MVQDIVACNYHLSSFGLTTYLSSSRLNASWTSSRPPSPNPHLSTLMWLMNAIKPGIKPNPTLRLNTQATGVTPWWSRIEPVLGESSHLRVHPEGYVTTPPWKRTRSNSASVIGGKRYIFVNRPLKKKGWTLQVWGLIPLGWSESSNPVPVSKNRSETLSNSQNCNQNPNRILKQIIEKGLELRSQ